MMMVPAFPEAGAPSRIRHNRSANNAFVDAAQLAAGRPIVRLMELSKLNGGLSHLLGVLLDTYMFNPEGVNMSLSVIALAMAFGVVILRATSAIFIGDEPALADMCLAKGLAGIKSCMRCANLVLCRYFVEARGAPHNVRSTEVDFSKFEPRTVARFRMTLLRLKDMHTVLNKNGVGSVAPRVWSCTRELRRNGAPIGYAEVLATSKAPEAASASAPKAASASALVPSAEASEKRGIAPHA